MPQKHVTTRCRYSSSPHREFNLTRAIRHQRIPANYVYQKIFLMRHSNCLLRTESRGHLALSRFIEAKPVTSLEHRRKQRDYGKSVKNSDYEYITLKPCLTQLSKGNQFFQVGITPRYPSLGPAFSNAPDYNQTDAWQNLNMNNRYISLLNTDLALSRMYL